MAKTIKVKCKRCYWKFSVKLTDEQYEYYKKHGKTNIFFPIELSAALDRNLCTDCRNKG